MRIQDVYWLNELSTLRHPLLGLSLGLLHVPPCARSALRPPAPGCQQDGVKLNITSSASKLDSGYGSGKLAPLFQRRDVGEFLETCARPTQSF
jgi:hypothetical protein